MDDIHNKAASSILKNNQDKILLEILQQDQAKIQQEQKFGLDNQAINYDTINLSKEHIFFELLGLNRDKGLTSIFTKYFKNKINFLYITEDLIEITKLHPQFIEETKKVNLKDKPNKRGYFTFFNNNQCIIGCSSVDRAVWFVFTNDKLDVNNGSIYVRESSIKTIKLFSTFEVNAFASTKVVGLDETTNQTVVKNKITYIPNWLGNTLNGIQKAIFDPLFKR